MKKLSPAQRLLNNTVIGVAYTLFVFYALQLESDTITSAQFDSNLGNLILWCVAIWSSLTLSLVVIRDKMIKQEKAKRRAKRVGK